MLDRPFSPNRPSDHLPNPTVPIYILEMLTEGCTLHLDRSILPLLMPLFLSCMGIDAYGFAGRGVDISYGSIGGGDDASTRYGRRDTDDASASVGGANML